MTPTLKAGLQKVAVTDKRSFASYVEIALQRHVDEMTGATSEPPPSAAYLRARRGAKQREQRLRDDARQSHERPPINQDDDRLAGRVAVVAKQSNYCPGVRRKFDCAPETLSRKHEVYPATKFVR